MTSPGNESALDDSQGSDSQGEENKEDLSKLSRQDLFKRITNIWQVKKKFNYKLIDMSNEIENKKSEIKDIKTKMALESNELNVMGNEILKIENKIKELTQAGKAQANDDGKKEKGDDKNKQNAVVKPGSEAANPFQKIENQQLFNNLAQYLSGQILDDVTSDSHLLLEIQETKQVVESVLVKHLNFDPSHITDFSDIPSFTQTFRIYRNTKFADLKGAACKFWEKLEQSYELTDEYFNNLDTFQGTVCDFYNGSYAPLNPEGQAIVYLYKSNLQQQQINQLQVQSIIIKSKGNQEEEGGVDSLSKKGEGNSKNLIDTKLILSMLPGLKTYQEPTSKELKPFIEKINPNRRKLNSMIILILGLFCLITTLSEMIGRYGNSTLYELLKQVQLFTIAKFDGASAGRLDLVPASINTRNDLVNYLNEYVPTNFFFEADVLAKIDDLTDAEKDYQAPLLQRNMEIIGQIVLMTSHVEQQECDGPEKFRFCYPILNLSEEQFSTKDLIENASDDPSLGWAVHQTAADIGLEPSLYSGELSNYMNSGYLLKFDAQTTSQEDYLKQFEEAQTAYFGNGARNVVLSFAVYSQSLNYWVHVQLLFEYSISDQVIFSKSFQQFRTDIYETPIEQAYYVLDLIRLVTLITVALAYIVEQGMDIYQNQFTFGRLVKIIAIVFCLAMFVLELAYMGMQTSTVDILAQSDEVIDFSPLVVTYQILYYVQAINLILLICFLIPFFQFLTDIQSTLNVITNIGSLILLFGCLWWAFAFMFAYVISNTWGYQLKGFRNLQSAILQMLATMVLASNEERLSFENKETGEQFKFLFILSLTIYVLKLLIVSQVTAIIIEQYRKVMLNWKAIADQNRKAQNGNNSNLSQKSVCMDWIYLSFCFRSVNSDPKKGKGGKKGKKGG